MRKLVITRDVNAFKLFVKDKVSDDYKYVANSNDLRGVARSTPVLTVGNWGARPDYMELRRLVYERDLQIVPSQ